MKSRAINALVLAFAGLALLGCNQNTTPAPAPTPGPQVTPPPAEPPPARAGTAREPAPPNAEFHESAPARSVERAGALAYLWRKRN